MFGRTHVGLLLRCCHSQNGHFTARELELRDQLKHSEQRNQALTREFQIALAEQAAELDRFRSQHSSISLTSSTPSILPPHGDGVDGDGNAVAALAAERDRLQASLALAHAQVAALSQHPTDKNLPPALAVSSSAPSSSSAAPSSDADLDQAYALLDAARAEIAALESRLAAAHREVQLGAQDHRAAVAELRWRCEQAETEVETQVRARSY